MLLENNPEKNQKPSFKDLETSILSTINDGDEFIGKILPRIEHLCDENPQALKMFCESPKGFGDILVAHNLIGNSKSNSSIQNS